MTETQWSEQYERLTKAFSRDFDKGQFEVYFDVLGEHGNASIDYAVTRAIAESPKFPRVSELVSLVHSHRREHAAPAAMCDVCAGTRFIVTNCAGKQFTGQMGDYQRSVVAIDHGTGYVCARDFPHAKHEDAHPCWQCHPLGIKRRQEAGA